MLDEITDRGGDDVFEALDRAFYAVPENVDSLLAAYVAVHDAQIARAPAHTPDV